MASEWTRLSRELFDAVTNGTDLRVFVRDAYKTSETDARIGAAILLLSYEAFPESIGDDEHTTNEINKRGLASMTDQEFRTEVYGAVSARKN